MQETIMSMQEVLGEFSDIIVGRMGIPRDEVNAIAIPTVDAILYGGKSAVISD